jgi:hypothetical protein
MAHAAAAAAVPLRRPLLLVALKPTTRLLSSLAAPPPGLRGHPRALRPAGPPRPTDAAGDTDDPDAGGGGGDAAATFRRNRSELKRKARRGVKWGMELAKLPPPQIKRILRAASLEAEVFEALMLVKVQRVVGSAVRYPWCCWIAGLKLSFRWFCLQKFGPDVREGKRRQYNYIGIRLLLSSFNFFSLRAIHLRVAPLLWCSDHQMCCACFCSFESRRVCKHQV